MRNEQDHQDPILTPGNLRQIVQNLPGKIKNQHTDYDYSRDTSIFENELDEFFNYSEVTIQLQEYRRLYEKEYDNLASKDVIVTLLDKLENSDQSVRIQACKHLVHLSTRTSTAPPSKTEIIRNNELLQSCGSFNVIYQKLQLSVQEYHQPSTNQQSQLGICTEIDLYLTMLYIMLETQRLSDDNSTPLQNELLLHNPNLIGVLFSTIAKTREKTNTHFPIKKSILLLWKSILFISVFISGGLDSIKQRAVEQRKSFGLDSSNLDIVTKCRPDEYLHFQNETLSKYPGFHPPDLPIDMTSPLTTINANHSLLAKAMGFANAAEKTDLLYQTLFPPKSTKSTNSIRKKNLLLQEYFPDAHHLEAFPLPLQHTGSDVPKSIQEAGQVFIDHMYVSLGTLQMMQEKSKSIHKWQTATPSPHVNESTIDRIYSNVLPHLQSFIVVILKLSLASVTTTTMQQHVELEDEPITLEFLEQVDTIRNKEILLKAISGLLLVLLKWTKSSHILKFEYISQLLVDSGCLLLILKILGLQEVSELVRAQTDLPYYGFFGYNINRTSLPEKPKHEEEAMTTNWRNMYWSINLLRILQMLTKHKSHRTMVLVQYKSAAILKRILKIAHPVLELYALKLLKNQVPYLGKKWRSQNMKIVSSIYLSCKTKLKDDWVSKIESEDEEENAIMQEKVMRILIQIYHHEKHGLPLPIHDELDSLENPSGPGYNGWIDYDLHKHLDLDTTDLELEDTDLDTIKYDYDVTPAPYPSTKHPPTFTPEQLRLEIHKLYIDELNSEFRANLSSENEQWPTTPLPKKLTPLSRYTGGDDQKSYLRTSRSLMKLQDEQGTEQLQDNILARLMEVEEKVSEKWFNDTYNQHNMYHYKMFDDNLYYSDEHSLVE